MLSNKEKKVFYKNIVGYKSKIAKFKNEIKKIVKETYIQFNFDR